MADTANYILSILTIIAQLAIVFLIWIKLSGKDSSTARFVSQRLLILSFLVALGATLGSLFYSKIIGYEPCVLCWYQRIFMFPQVFILGLALIKKDFSVMPYIKTLSLIGLVIAGYQSLLQMDLVPSIACSASAISCAQRYFLTFGYITLPLMGFTAFMLLIMLASFRRL